MTPFITVMLVHGAWPQGVIASLVRRIPYLRRLLASKPAWNACPGQFESKLRERILLPDSFACRIVEFNWEGRNGIRSRRRAAEKLAGEIDAAASAGASKIFVVAHSHGGNVAAQAARISQARLAGIISLGTPFISASARSSTASERVIRTQFWSVVAALIILPTLAVYFLAVSWIAHEAKAMIGVGFEDGGNAFFDTWLPALFFSACALLLVVAASALERVVMKSRFLKAAIEWREDWKAYLIDNRNPSPFLAIRASGDEAFSALMAGQILNIVQQKVTRILSSSSTRGFSYVQLYGTHHKAIFVIWAIPWFLAWYFNDRYLAWLVPAFLPLALNLLATMWGLLVSVASILLTLFTTVLAMLATAPFGLDLVLLSQSIDIQVEEVPSDAEVEVRFLSKNAVSDLLLTNRHKLYDVDIVIAHVGQWISDHVL